MPLPVRSFLTAILALPGFLSVAEAQPQSTQEKITHLEALWNEAHLRGDVDQLDRLWAPDITVVVPEIRPFKKPELLQMWRTMKVVFSEYKTSDLRVQLYGHTAIVTGRLHRSRDFGGQVRTEDWLFTKTYAEVEGQWKVVAYHASTAPAS